MERPQERDLLSALIEQERLALESDAIVPPHVPPDHAPADVSDDGWWPDMSKTGRKIFDSDKPYILVHGERGSSKTTQVLHKVIRHCYENNNALAVICVITRTSATEGGAWEKLYVECLPQWKAGIGLEYVGPKMDDARNCYIWVGNSSGGWSKILLRSMLHAEQIEARIKGIEPSLFFFDELTETDDEGYFTYPIKQLGRRPGIALQPFIACCNPSNQGQDHWVYKRFFPWTDEDGKFHEPGDDYTTFHLPMRENKWLPKDKKANYIKRLMEASRNDPTALERDILGKWVKRKSGNGIFATQWSRETHMAGDPKKDTRILPDVRFPLEIGYDIGSANTAISFTQLISTVTGQLWTVFDEVVLINKRVPIFQIAPMVLGKMNFWCARMEHKFVINHISDSAAFNQVRTDGSYDARDFEAQCYRLLKTGAFPSLAHIPAIKMNAAPKGAGSVPGRARMTMAKLQSNQLLISSSCAKHIEMFEQLECEKEIQGNYKATLPFTPKKTAAGHIHVFDSMSYPMWFYEMGCLPLPPIDPENTKSEFLDLNV